VTAYVEPAPGPGPSPGPGFDAEALLAWAAGRLAPYKRPRIVHRVAELPRNKLGKVVRADLRPPEPD
jgi:long-chain acyl-CoA synthetase